MVAKLLCIAMESYIRSYGKLCSYSYVDVCDWMQDFAFVWSTHDIVRRCIVALVINIYVAAFIQASYVAMYVCPYLMYVHTCILYFKLLYIIKLCMHTYICMYIAICG